MSNVISWKRGNYTPTSDAKTDTEELIAFVTHPVAKFMSELEEAGRLPTKFFDAWTAYKASRDAALATYKAGRLGMPESEENNYDDYIDRVYDLKGAFTKAIGDAGAILRRALSAHATPCKAEFPVQIFRTDEGSIYMSAWLQLFSPTRDAPEAA